MNTQESMYREKGGQRSCVNEPPAESKYNGMVSQISASLEHHKKLLEELARRLQPVAERIEPLGKMDSPGATQAIKNCPLLNDLDMINDSVIDASRAVEHILKALVI